MLADWVLPPPWPLLASLAVATGLVALAVGLARRFDDLSRGLALPAAFVTVVAFLTSLIHALALAGLSSPWVLRAIGAAIVLAGTRLALSAERRWLGAIANGARRVWTGATFAERLALGGAAATTAALGLASLGPPTDIDTLAYHLSVPLDWLTHGGARAAPDWLHARLVGVGESMGLLGLALGTDSLGAVIQWTGIVLAAMALASLAATAADRVLAVVLVAACPLLPSIALTAKPQLLPAAATLVALALVEWQRRTSLAHLRFGSLALIFACAAFAVACKYSFIPAGAIVTGLALASVWSTPWRRAALVAAALAFAAIALPVYARNLAWYGDPVSPFLERFRVDADPVVRAFAWHLRNFAAVHTWERLLRLPWDMVVATGASAMTMVLGAGALAGLALPFRRLGDRAVAGAAVVLVLAGGLGQLQARFFFDAYLWFGLAAVVAPWTRRKRWLLVALTAQILVALPVAIYGAAGLLPGALTPQGRDRTLSRLAADYELAKWLDEVLPAGAVIAGDRHSNLFLPRPSLRGDWVRTLSIARVTIDERRSLLAEAADRKGADYLVVTEPGRSPLRLLSNDLGEPAFESPRFSDATRNPWRAGPVYRVRVYRMDAALGKVGSSP